MTNVLKQELTHGVVSLKVFSDEDIDDMIAAATTPDASVYVVPDDSCCDSQTLCNAVAELTMQKRFITLETIRNIVSAPIQLEEGDLP